MSAFLVKVDLGDTQKKLAELASRVTRLRPLFLQIGEALLESTQRRFVDEKGPDGNPWVPLSPAYLKSKAKAKSRFPTGILKKSGQMAQGIFYDATDQSVTIGSSEPYSAIQQFGGTTAKGGKIDARPFLGLDERDIDAISDLVKDHLTPN